MVSQSFIEEATAEDYSLISRGLPILLWNLDKKPLLDDNIIRNTNGQIVNLEWKTICQYTRAPLLSCILSICCQLYTWHEMYNDHISILYCPEALPNSAIVLAVYLKYTENYLLTYQAYDFFFSKRKLHMK